jgi:hypothetical protein
MRAAVNFSLACPLITFAHTSLLNQSNGPCFKNIPRRFDWNKTCVRNDLFYFEKIKNAIIPLKTIRTRAVTLQEQ